MVEGPYGVQWHSPVVKAARRLGLFLGKRYAYLPYVCESMRGSWAGQTLYKIPIPYLLKSSVS